MIFSADYASLDTILIASVGGLYIINVSVGALGDLILSMCVTTIPHSPHQPEDFESLRYVTVI